ncbi:MAG: hypothetical protein KBG20_18345, partial [Caldilineaceae bacterium]|nr:hypothetical protein [Caldilineaceae bacterium]MBP8107370.1 hypothetical protein [Caldilineaceae bacterium]MBP8124279.1 hypothetical protein [Caldilineaceae bacterium]MBP9074273.1 hypothetical protein [Caldilineaceae bacterium]
MTAISIPSNLAQFESLLIALLVALAVLIFLNGIMKERRHRQTQRQINQFVNAGPRPAAILNMGQRQQKKARKEGVCAGGQREIKTMDLCGGLQMKREN